MEYIEKNKSIWEKHFENVRLDYPNEQVIRFLAKYKSIYKNGKMLDWGCATGRHTVLGCKFGYRVYAADYVENCVNMTKEKVEKECKEYIGKVEKYIVNQDLDVEEIKDEELDIILIFGVMFYNNKVNQKQMLDNTYRMLKKGGRVFCDFRTQDDSIYINSKVGNQIGDDTFVLGTDTKSEEGLLLNISSLEELESMFKSSGFVMENVEKFEFTQDNQNITNSWWHITLYKQ